MANMVPNGDHHVDAVASTYATDAVIRLREQLGLQPNEFEIVPIIPGSVGFS